MHLRRKGLEFADNTLDEGAVDENHDSLLSPLRVLDLTNEKGHYLCAKVSENLGAQVVRIEKPGEQKDVW